MDEWGSGSKIQEEGGAGGCGTAGRHREGEEKEKWNGSSTANAAVDGRAGAVFEGGAGGRWEVVSLVVEVDWGGGQGVVRR